MGSTGGLINKPTSNADKYTVFGIGDKTDAKSSLKASTKWFDNPKLSNAKEWRDDLLTYDERDAIESYTGYGYNGVNNELYGTEWDKMSPTQKEKASNIYNGINKFELKHGITVTRQCDFRILGSNTSMTKDDIVKQLSKSKGYIQNDGFLSFSANSKGAPIDSSGLIISLRIPPSKGAGAYVNPISQHSGAYENEFIVNSNSVLKFDLNSIKSKDGKIYIEADWVGQAKQQTIDKKNKSTLAKKNK